MLNPLSALILTRQVSLDTFLQGCECAWAELPHDTRRALRAVCRSGRLLHDHLMATLDLQLGYDNTERSDQLDVGPRNPTPAELHTCVHGVLQRGARLANLTLNFKRSERFGHLPFKQREEQL